MVKLHLFVVEGADEEESGEAVQSMQGRGHGANHQAKGDVVVLEGGPEVWPRANVCNLCAQFLPVIAHVHSADSAMLYTKTLSLSLIWE